MPDASPITMGDIASEILADYRFPQDSRGEPDRAYRFICDQIRTVHTLRPNELYYGWKRKDTVAGAVTARKRFLPVPGVPETAAGIDP